MEKYARFKYMPCLPLGEDGRRITASKKHTSLSRKAATEGMVLLKNENKAVFITENGIVCELRSSRYNINPIAVKYDRTKCLTDWSSILFYENKTAHVSKISFMHLPFPNRLEQFV